MIQSRIIGTGHYLPEKILTNKDLEKFMDTTDEWIRQRTGISQRHVVEKGQGSSDVAAPAALMAIKNAGVDPKDIDLIVCGTTSPDHIFPTTGCVVQAKIGASNAAAYDVNAACSGFVYALATADAFIKTGRYKNVLTIGVDVASSYLNYERRETAVLFGDGAGAVVMQPDENGHGILMTYLGADGAASDLLHMVAGGSKEPIRADNVNSPSRDIVMKGPELFKRAVLVFGEAIQKALDETGLTVDDIALFIPHQANTRIIQTAADRMKIPAEKVYMNMDKVANTTAGSIPLALSQAVEEGRVKKGDYVLLASFGAGLTWGSAMIRW